MQAPVRQHVVTEELDQSGHAKNDNFRCKATYIVIFIWDHYKQIAEVFFTRYPNCENAAKGFEFSNGN